MSPDLLVKFPTQCFFKVNNKWRRSIAFIVNFEQISHIVLVFLFLTSKGRLLGFPNLFGKSILITYKFCYFLFSTSFCRDTRWVWPVTQEPLCRIQDQDPKLIKWDPGYYTPLPGLRTSDPLFCFTRYSSNHSVTYTPLYYDYYIIYYF